MSFHIEKMIATLREKARHEQDSLTKTLMDYKQQLEKAKAIEKREHKLQQSRDDASTIQHLKTLNDELSKLSVVSLPDLPSIKYSHKQVTDSDIDQLIETYSLRYVHVKSSFVLISCLKVVLRLEIDSFILDTVCPLCLPVTHCAQTEILQLSQTKRKSSLCSLHLNFTSGTTFSPL
jgi:hypothetical protein